MSRPRPRLAADVLLARVLADRGASQSAHTVLEQASLIVEVRADTEVVLQAFALRVAIARSLHGNSGCSLSYLARALNLAATEGFRVSQRTGTPTGSAHAFVTAESPDAVFAFRPSVPGSGGRPVIAHYFPPLPLTIGKYAIENIGKKYLILAEDYAFGQATAAKWSTRPLWMVRQV